MELYVLNENLQTIDIIDDYSSLIWAKRYNDVGDCELYVGVSLDNLASLKRGYYLKRSDDDMVCRIKKIELQTDVENGDYLVVTGYDAKDILNQRIVWEQLNFVGKVEDYIIRIIKDSFNMQQLEEDPPKRTQRQILNFKIADRNRGFNEEISESVQYDNVGEKVKSLCKTFGYGYRVYVDGSNLMFDLYKGNDVSNRVIFSHEYDNLIKSNYIEDSSNIGNVALVGGMEDPTTKKKITSTAAHESGINRYEFYVDASTSNTCTYLELKTLYPNGQIIEESPTYIVYKVSKLDIILIDNIQFQNLKESYSQIGRTCYKKEDGTYYIITDDNKSLGELQEEYPNKVLLYQIDNPIVANLTTAKKEGGVIIPPQDKDNVTLANVIYDDYLLNKGYEEIANRGLSISFEGDIEASQTFEYERDYNLGDLVLVENEYAIRSIARITEIVEIYDENGYSMQPKFEFHGGGLNGN